jgi:hypothetical protein
MTIAPLHAVWNIEDDIWFSWQISDMLNSLFRIRNICVARMYDTNNIEAMKEAAWINVRIALLIHRVNRRNNSNCSPWCWEIAACDPSTHEKKDSASCA